MAWGMSKQPVIDQEAQPQSFPRIDALIALQHSIWNSRPDLQESFADADSDDFWFWLMWSGSEYYQEVKEALYPLPDRYLLDRVVGEFVPEKNFHTSGIVDARRMIECLRSPSFDFSQNSSVLDFGCGCSRLLRFFARWGYDCNFHGADVDSDAIKWCETNIDFARFRSINENPPTPFSDSAFDAAYSYSVFSHFSKKLHLSWLDELHRITKPGAILVLTVQGKAMFDKSNSEINTDKNRDAFNQNGFLFVPYQNLEFLNPKNQDYYDQWDLGAYGDAFILKPYIEREWTKWFDTLDLIESPDNSQDYVILRNKK